jgi:hypothetical protein
MSNLLEGHKETVLQISEADERGKKKEGVRRGIRRRGKVEI